MVLLLAASVPRIVLREPELLATKAPDPIAMLKLPLLFSPERAPKYVFRKKGAVEVMIHQLMNEDERFLLFFFYKL